ncbi:MAG: BspA family leucine-rich repeat surface protein [Lachnospiraceae bacterium]|nr:BspA family leucine-rich repeat surface protein [Lachnospiraceae bacterium]
MKNFKRLISTILIVSMIMGSTLTSFAASDLTKRKVSTSVEATSLYAEDAVNDENKKTDENVEGDARLHDVVAKKSASSSDIETEDGESASDVVEASDASPDTEEPEEDNKKPTSTSADHDQEKEISEKAATESDVESDSENKNEEDSIVEKPASSSEINDNEHKKEDSEKDISTKSDIEVVALDKATKSDASDEIFSNGFIQEDFTAPIVKKKVRGGLFGDTSVPSSFDPRGKTNATTGLSILPDIRRQKYNTCWAYATIGAIETNIRLKGLASTDEDANLSELALAYFMYNLENVTNNKNTLDKPGLEGNDYRRLEFPTKKYSDVGGNVANVAMTASSYMGFVREYEHYTLEDEYDRFDDAKTTPLDGKYAFNTGSYVINDVLFINKTNREEVKKAIMQYGSVEISFYGDGNGQSAAAFDNVYNGEHYQFPNAPSNSANHAVIVVGWDENIPRASFSDASGQHPSSNGGWLCRNSWGNYSWANGGYFWMSYEEPSIGSNMYAIDVIERDTYKYNYHYDTTGVMGYNGGTLPSENGSQYSNYFKSYGNVFKVSDDKDQTLDAINIGLCSADTKFDILVYTKDTKMSSPYDGTLKLKQENVTKTFAGVYTIKLDKKVYLKKGTYYGVSIIAKDTSTLEETSSGVYKKKFYIYTDQNNAHQQSVDGEIGMVRDVNEVAAGQSFVATYNSSNGSFSQIADWYDYDGLSWRIKGLTNPVVLSEDVPDYYVFGSDWFDANVVGISKSSVQNITFLRYGDTVPTDVDATWNLPSTSNGLKGYRKGNDIYIYAEHPVPIMMAEDASYLFSDERHTGFTNLLSINNLNYLDTSNVKNMKGMFYFCRELRSIDLSTFITKNVENMAEMFWLCQKVDKLDLSTFDTSNVTNMNSMFSSCVYLEDLNISSFDTSKVKNMRDMFCDCHSLTTLDLSHFNTSNVTDMAEMFYFFTQSSQLKSLNISKFDTRNVKDMAKMFEGCAILKVLDLRSFDTSSAEDMNQMFKNCTNLTRILASSSFVTTGIKAGTSLSPALYYSSIFAGCTNLVGGAGTAWTAEHASDKTYARIDTNATPGYFSVDYADDYDYVLSPGWFSNEAATALGDSQGALAASDILHIEIRTYGIDNPIASYAEKYDVPNTSLNTYGKNLQVSRNQYATVVIYAPKLDDAEDRPVRIKLAENCSELFKGFANLKTIKGLDRLYTGEVTNMHEMFANLANLESLNVSSFITASVSDMSGMFAGTFNNTNIPMLNLSGFNTENVTTFENMFQFNGAKCINLSSFDTSRATNMSFMFAYSKIEELDLSGFDTSNVVKMTHMISAPEISSIDVSSFDTRKVGDMEGLFYSMPKLKSVDISSFDTRHFADSTTVSYTDSRGMTEQVLTNTRWMFAECHNLEKIIASSNFLPGSDHDNMFGECYKLKGGKDTEFSEGNVNGDYACIDEGPYSSKPGYFTGSQEAPTPSPTSYDYVLSPGWYSNMSSVPSTYTLSSSDIEKIEFKAYGMGYDSDISTDTLYQKIGEIDDSSLNSYGKKLEVYYSQMFDGNSYEDTIVIYAPKLSDSEDRRVFIKMANDSRGLFGHSFDGLISIEGLDRLSTADVTNMQEMFLACDKLEKLDLSSFDTRNVTNMSRMFEICASLKKLNLISFDTNNVVAMSNMFSGCGSLTMIEVGDSFVVGSNVTTDNMFAGCNKLQGSNGTKYSDSHKDGGYACIDTATAPGYFFAASDYVFVPGWYSNTFRPESRYIEKIEFRVYGLDSDPSKNSSYEKIGEITGSSLNKYGKKLEVYYGQFVDANNTLYDKIVVYAPKLDDSDDRVVRVKMADDSTMLFGHSFDGVTNIIGLNKLSTRNVESMEQLFVVCMNLKEVDISNLDTINVVNMHRMFSDCGSLTSLDLANFDTSNVTNMYMMFSGCSSLTSLNLTSFDTSSVTNMNNMFTSCTSLTLLDLTSFDTSNVTEMNNMFSGCTSLATIKASNSFVVNNGADTQDMFFDCGNLIGGNNTVYSDSHIDGEYARIDTAATPGYFTDGGSTPTPTSVTYTITFDQNHTDGGTWGSVETYISDSFDWSTNLADIMRTETSGAFNTSIVIPGNEKWMMMSFMEGKLKKLVGWNTASDGSGHSYSFNQELTAHTNDFDAMTHTLTLYAKWEEVPVYTFNMCYIASDSDAKENKLIFSYDYPNNFERILGAAKSGYDGWYLVQDGGDVASDIAETSYDEYATKTIASDAALKTIFNAWQANPTKNVVYGACYERPPVTYTIRFDANGVNATTPSEIEKTVDKAIDGGLPNPTNIPAGYEFIGWYKEAAGVNPYDGSSDLTNVQDDIKTIYAKWKTALVFNANGHGTAPASIPIEGAQSVNLPNITAEGYTFEGWYDDPTDFSASHYVGGAGDPKTINAPTTYYAKWTANKYYIKYNLNTTDTSAVLPSGTTNPFEKTYDSNVNLATPSRLGYEFDGWYKNFTSPNTYTGKYEGVGDLQSAVGTEANAVNIYAKWKAVEYTITYNVNGGDMPSGVSNTFKKTYGTPITAALVSPTKKGYTFKGWFTDETILNDEYDKTEDTIYQGVESIHNIYAKWEAVEYTITYDAKGGTVTPGTFTKTYDTDITTNLATPTKTGYTFGGWFTDDDAFTEPYDKTSDDIYTSPTATHTIYAKWTPNTYTINYDTVLSGVTINANSVTKTYDKAVSLAEPTKTGWKFDGWYINYDATSKTYTQQYAGANDDAYISETESPTIYAKWTAVTYTIKYNTNDGTLPSGVSESFTKTYDSNYTLASPSKIGYDFDGWYSDATLNTSYDGSVDLSTMQGDTKNIFAKYIEKEYPITFNRDGGEWVSGYTAPDKRKYTEEVTLPDATKIVKYDGTNNYRFDGWHAQSDLSDNVVTKISAGTVGPHTYYADWTPAWLVTFDVSNGGADIGAAKVASQSIVDGDKAVRPTNNPSASGFRFDGWYHSDMTTVFDFENESITANTIIYAKWTAIQTITFNFDMNGHGDQVNTQYVPENTKVTKPGDPVATGYKFIHWYEGTDDSVAFDFEQVITSNSGSSRTLKAKWEEKKYSVTYYLNGGNWDNVTYPTFNPDEERLYTETITLPAATYVKRTGYDFVAWCSDERLSNTIQEIPANTDEDKKVYAKWEAKTYTITYHLGTASVINSGRVDSYKYGEGATLPTDVSPSEGRAFAGWYAHEDFSGSKITKVGATETENKDYYAKYAVRYIISFDANGGSGTMNPQYVYEGETTTINPNTFTRSGYSFTRWDGSDGRTYANRADVSTLSYNLTLKAVWASSGSNNNSSGNRGNSSGNNGGTVAGPTSVAQFGPASQAASQAPTLAQALANGNVTRTPVNTANVSITPIAKNTERWTYDPVNNKWKMSGMNGLGQAVAATNAFFQVPKTVNVTLNGMTTQTEVNDTYYFDANGDMVTGWMQTSDGKFYFFEDAKTMDEGKMSLGWKQIDGAWYYFTADGSMQVGGVTPDGYTISADGQWKQ